MVHFVGAGPGAADLITVRGRKYLEEADLVIYAGSLVNPELLQYTKSSCRVRNSALMTLPEVLEEIRLCESRGGTTVRLHTGDTSLYSTIREQIDALDEAGIAWDVCPGVSAFSGAAASLGEELTLPGISQTLILTRAAGRTAVPEKEALRLLAGHGASMALYLSAGQAENVRRELLAGGYPPETPAAVVYKATWPGEKVLRTTLGELADAMEREEITKTALILVGAALKGGGFYEKSRLYSADFSTEFRKAVKQPEE